jgi:NtrC-family two-component system sensor histidine kinase KinB
VGLTRDTVRTWIYLYLWWIIGLAGVASLLAWIWASIAVIGQMVVVIAVGGLCIAFLTVFPIPIGQDEANLSHAITLSLGMALTPQIACWSLLLGFPTGLLVRHLLSSRGLQRRRFSAQLPTQVNSFGRQAVGLSAAMFVYRALGGEPAIAWDAYSSLLPAIYMGFAFSILHLLFHWGSTLTLGVRRTNGRETTLLVLSTVLAIPYALLGSAAIATLGLLALSAIGSIVCLLSFVLHGHEHTAHGLVAFRKASISLRDGLELETLLANVHELVRELLDVENITIAILDEEEGILRYPYASRDGRRYYWPSWPFSDSLSQEVIRMAAPLLLPRRAAVVLSEMGCEPSMDTPGAWLGVPLYNPQGAFGCLAVFHSRVGRSLSFLDQEMLEKIAEPVSTAIESALLLEKTKLRAQALASLHEIAATHDVEDLVQNILTRALSFTDAPRGHIALYEQELDQLRVSAQWGYPDGSPIVEGRTTLGLEYGIPSRALRMREVIRHHDALKDPEYIEFGLVPAHSVLCAPIIHQGLRVGVITVESEKQGRFTAQHERILAQLAAQSAIAITNARLVNQLEARLREQSLLYQASAQLAASLDPEAVALAVADSLAVAISTDGAGISRYEAQSGALHMLAAVIDGRPVRDPSTASISISEAPELAFCIGRGEPQQWTIEDAPTEKDLAYLTEIRRASSVLALPLMAGDRCLGVIEAHSSKVRFFDQNEIRTAQTIASQAAIAVQNADLFLKIQESHDLLRTVLNASNEGILMFDTQGRILVANNRLAELTGLEREAIVGRDIRDSYLEIARKLGYPPQKLESLVANMGARGPLDAGGARTEVRSPMGAPLSRADTPVTDAEGQLVGWLVSLRDVSEERKLEQDRQHLTEMIVHDLRSPLTAILGSLTLLERTTKDLDSPVTDQAIAIANLSCQQVLGLVNSLLDIGGLESGDLKLSLEQVAIDEMSRDLVSRYVQEANQYGILLDFHAAQRIPPIEADSEKIQRVLINLLDNALKFTPAGGQVDLSLSTDDSHLLITVRDTGPGIPEEFRERIFERFSQIPGTSGRRRGTGLGLAFAKLAVEAHGGRIWVEGGEEQGSIFHILLPFEAESEPGR